jgi:ethanolamine ammonia-lyase large subunit
METICFYVQIKYENFVIYYINSYVVYIFSIEPFYIVIKTVKCGFENHVMGEVIGSSIDGSSGVMIKKMSNCTNRFPI